MSGVGRDRPDGFGWFPADSECQNENFQNQILRIFKGKNGISKKLQLGDREFLSATISGAGGANHASQAGSSIISRRM